MILRKYYVFYILKVEAKYGQIMAYARLHTIINNYVIDVIDSNRNYAEYPITSWMSAGYHGWTVFQAESGCWLGGAW